MINQPSDSPDSSALLSDPVFQLNLGIWMLQQFPDEASIHPILSRAGYVLDSISRKLPPSPSMRPVLVRLAGSDGAPSPDILAQGPPDSPWLILECKGASFGPQSSNSKQALKLMAVASDLSDALGLAGDPQPAGVCYLTTSQHHVALASTLEHLRTIIESASLPVPSIACLGVSRDEDGIYVEMCPQDDSPAGLKRALPARQIVVKNDPGDDPRPLYYVPWDPGVSQDPEQSEYCRSLLNSRLSVAAAGTVGRSRPPRRVTLKMETLLSDATFGVSDQWRSRSDLGRTLRNAKRFLKDALKDLAEQLAMAVPTDPDRIEITVRNESDCEAAVDALLRANPLGGPEPEDEDHPTLFDH